MKRLLLNLATLLIAMTASSQTDWKNISRLIDSDGSYKTAYSQAEKVYANPKAPSRERLTAAWYMAKAAAMYQEEAYDSSRTRYEALLPQLEAVDRALCHAFLGQYEQALADEALQQATPVEAVKEFCADGKTANMTPTVYDMLVVMMQDRGDLTPQQRVEWQQRLVDFHKGDADDDFRLWHDLRLLTLMEQVPNRPVADEVYLQYVDRYRGTRSALYTQLHSHLAQRSNAKGDYVEALRWCDSAIAFAPKSEGAVECANLRNEITRVRIDMDNAHLTVAPARQSLQRVTCRNTGHLYLRIIPYVEGFSYGDKTRSQLLAAQPLQQWDVAVATNNEYRPESSLIALPALKAGHYLLLASPTSDFKAQGFMAFEVNCTDMLLVQNGSEGLLLDRTTGQPIAGQTLRVERRQYNKSAEVLSTATTDRDGRYRFDLQDERWGLLLMADRDGYRLTTSFRRSAQQTAEETLRAELRTDRPIYKPGETLQAAVLCYTSDGLDAAVATGIALKITLTDPNGQEVDTLMAKTDDYGMANATFTIPTDRIAGNYTLRVRVPDRTIASASVRVEEYKQPKFMVTLDPSGEAAPRFGQPYIVRGLAASYSAVPISGARVQYSIERRRLNRWWWRWWGYEEGSTVAEGELTTAADGSFAITFTPEPDSNVELSHKPTFEYIVRVDVTDVNGESHPASHSMRVGFRNAFLSLEGGEEVATLDDLKVKHFDLNGNPLQGKVDVKIERLRQPAVPLLDAPAMQQGDHNTLGEDDFRKAFPLYAYHRGYNDRSRWAVASEGWKGESGVYRITLSAEGADTAVEYRVVTIPTARKVQSQRLLWVADCPQVAEVGSTVTLRFGSRFSDVEVYYLMRVGTSERDFRRIRISDNIKEVRIPVDSTMLGGFNVDLMAVHEGVIEQWNQRIDVPFSHKQLKVEIATFRDKLLPGEQEEWTLRVESGERRVESEMVMTMYDDALNNYGSASSWSFSPWRSNASNSLRVLTIGNGQGYWLSTPRHSHYSGSYPTVWSLLEALPHYNRWGRGHVMYKSARAASANVMYNMVTEEAEEEVVLSIEADMAAPTAAAKEVAMADEVITAGEDAGGGEAPEVQLRTNLNTLAFFVPSIRTDADGMATYRFTVPELLTRWSIKGLAVTKDIKIGTLDRTLITQKPLMVQPNLPRFLRHGDSLALMAKVVRTEPGEAIDVSVNFLLTDAATGDTLCCHTEHVRVSDAAQVMFPVEVPRDVYVATYRITAEADGMSDGEQGQVPVVSSRQAVTLSQPLYINGVGEKHFTMTLPQSTTAEPHLLAAEVVNNPMWLAIKAMPYLQELESPSNIYLANRLYMNRLGQKILVEIDKIDLLDKLEGPAELETPSRLKMNEDVKQTLLQATPWVRNAQSEEEQRQAMAAYFDKERIAKELAAVSSQLAERQNGDGGWSWMPEGRSSVWVTQQVLKKLSAVGGQQLAASSQRALAYIDREEQAYYDRWIKPYLKKGIDCQPTNIDYLYTRSFYGKGKTEAYKYYYANALKRYKDYEHLYTQAQLALVFHRAGDKKQALDLLRRLKEKALTSDEMGTWWRDNRSGWFWYQRPVETQALLIQAFSEITPKDTTFIGQMQQWLLKQKQTTHWGNDEATVKAIDALMVGSGEHSLANSSNATSLSIFGTPMTAEAERLEGYASQRWTGAALGTVLASGNSAIVLKKSTPGIAWGGVYYQYTDDMDKIPSSESGITLKRTYQHEGPLKVGDRVKVWIDISCDRTMEYLELTDGRAACFEPLSTQAGWRWNEGLSYYIVVGNTATRCYIDRLEKGRYWFEYEVYVTNPGTFLSGPVTMQCMYAPEFRATAPAARITVTEK